MSAYCHVVPWYNSEEWIKVYEELSDPSSNKEDLLRTLLVWKARCPSLPSGIESTLSLLQVHVGDLKRNQDEADDQLLRLAYSSAIMRFVNHMLDSETSKGTSLYHAAQNLGVPDWIIDLRHDTAHSNNLPRLTLLREACGISLQWLQQNYWEKYKPKIQDYVSSQKEINTVDEDSVAILINLCTSLSICAHHNCKIRNVLEIPNLAMRESILNDIKNIFGDQIDTSNLKTVSIMSLINMINNNSHVKNLLKVPDVFKHVHEVLLGDDSLFLSKDLLLFFSSNDFRKKRLNNSYVQCYEALLSFLHTNDLLLEFVLALIKITQDNDSPYFKAQLAALWVAQILTALKRTQEFSQKLKKMSAEDKQPTKKRDLKQLYHHWFPSNKGKNLLLDLHKPVPEQLLDISFIQPIIATYNPYLVHFIRNLLDLIQPPISKIVAERVYQLAEVISRPEKFSPSGSTIYTVDDIKLSSDNHDVKISEVQPEHIDVTQEQENQEVYMNSIWKLAPKNHNWSSCPIGILPWQLNNYEKHDVQTSN